MLPAEQGEATGPSEPGAKACGMSLPFPFQCSRAEDETAHPGLSWRFLLLLPTSPLGLSQWEVWGISPEPAGVRWEG